MPHMVVTVVAVIAAVFVAAAAAAVPADEVVTMPGYGASEPPITFRHYSGYLYPAHRASKAMHYHFVEHETAADVATAPLLLWLNGGPGCSSLYGFFREIGPFKFDFTNTSDMTLYRNRYAWTTEANVLFLESPVGVGFSYSNSSDDYINDDEGTAEDNYETLLAFFDAFPAFAGRDVYISGESYAGIYIPTLAVEILRRNAAGGSPLINLRGLLIGNGVTRPESDSVFNALAPLYCGHGVVSQDTCRDIVEGCSGGATPQDPRCLRGLADMSVQGEGLNRYQISTPCLSTPPTPEQQLATTMWGDMEVRGEVPCVDSTQQNTYLRSAEAMAALHVRDDIVWEICSSSLRYTKTLGSNSFQFYDEILRSIPIWHFFGEDDGAVPMQGGAHWSPLLGYPVGEAWRQWRVVHDAFGEQVAGYTVLYDTPYPSDYRFITVKAGWHTVPESHPQESLHMLRAFLTGSPL